MKLSTESLQYVQKAKETYSQGLSQHKALQYEDALLSYQAVMTYFPQHLGALFQSGCICMQQKKYSAARDWFLRCVQYYPEHFESYTNLATCELQLGHLLLAKNYYLRALQIQPNDLQILYNLGVLSAQMGEISAAIEYYQQAIYFNPDYLESHYNVGVIYLYLKKQELAMYHFQQVLAKRPDDMNLQHLVNIIKQEKDLSTSPIHYLQHLFDHYATHYDSHLIDTLHYQIPQVFASTLEKHQLDTTHRDILDVGCGTGLCAEILPAKHYLVGVDVSAKMLEVARQKNIYDQLVQEDIIIFMRNLPPMFDLIMAGDVLVYQGELKKFLNVFKQALKPGGYALFNTEVGKDSENFTLTTSGRFAHGKDYIESLLQELELDLIEAKQIPLRYQYEEIVMGWVYLVRKSSASSYK